MTRGEGQSPAGEREWQHPDNEKEVQDMIDSIQKAPEKKPPSAEKPSIWTRFKDKFGRGDRWEQEVAYIESLPDDVVKAEADAERAAVGITPEENAADLARINAIRSEINRMDNADVTGEKVNEGEVNEDGDAIVVESEYTQEELQAEITTHLCYQDSGISDDIKRGALQESLDSTSAWRYADSLLQMKKTYGEDDVLAVGRKLRETCVAFLDKKGVNSTPFATSETWALWDMAKQFFYGNTEQGKELAQKHPDYTPGDPMTNERLQQEIVQRHVGWEVWGEWSYILQNGGRRYANESLDKFNLSSEDRKELEKFFAESTEQRDENGYIVQPPSHLLQHFGEILMSHNEEEPYADAA